MINSSKRFVRRPPVAGIGRRTRSRNMLEATLGVTATTRVAETASASQALVHRTISPRGRSSRIALDQVRHIGAGRQCVVIGNGPSLKRTDLSLLRSVDTFGLNRLYLLFSRLGWGTTYHVAVNRLVVQQCRQELLAVPGRLFSTWSNGKDLASRGDAVFLDTLPGPLFSRDPRYGVWEGATVTYVALQLAYWMGYRDVVLVGVDHRFSTPGRAHSVVTSEGRDPNHFDLNYFGKGFNWQLPDLETSEIAYQLAKVTFEAAGGSVVDATVDGALRIFDRRPLEEALGL